MRPGWGRKNARAHTPASEAVVKKNISFDDYKNCVLKNEPKNVKVNAIRTVKMMNYSLTQNKLALSNKDDKRVWKNTTSTAWGHYQNNKK
jgi:hypothetical protein